MVQIAAADIVLPEIRNSPAASRTWAFGRAMTTTLDIGLERNARRYERRSDMSGPVRLPVSPKLQGMHLPKAASPAGIYRHLFPHRAFPPRKKVPRGAPRPDRISMEPIPKIPLCSHGQFLLPARKSSRDQGQCLQGNMPRTVRDSAVSNWDMTDPSSECSAIRNCRPWLPGSSFIRAKLGQKADFGADWRIVRATQDKDFCSAIGVGRLKPRAPLSSPLPCGVLVGPLYFDFNPR